MAEAIDIEELLYWAFRSEKVESTRNPPDDALTVYWAVMALPEPFAQLVRHHARIGRSPDWRSGPPNEKVVHIVAVRYWHERYTQWHRALSILCKTLNGALRQHVATGPLVPERPWKGYQAAPSRTARRA